MNEHSRHWRESTSHDEPVIGSQTPWGNADYAAIMAPGWRKTARLMLRSWPSTTSRTGRNIPAGQPGSPDGFVEGRIGSIRIGIDAEGSAPS